MNTYFAFQFNQRRYHFMKKGDFIWITVLLAIVAFLIFPTTHVFFVSGSATHPLFMAFVKFFILGTMGEWLGRRIVCGNWSAPTGLFLRALVWGFLGILIALSFHIFSVGVKGLTASNLLYTGTKDSLVSKILTAFFISLFMNAIFAPTMMGAHKLTDTYIDLSKGKFKNLSSVSLESVIEQIDFKALIQFVYFKTIPFFWIPAHTITFLLPPVYRVLMAAFLGIALGAILGFAKKKQTA